MLIIGLIVLTIILVIGVLAFREIMKEINEADERQEQIATRMERCHGTRIEPRSLVTINRD